MEEQEIYSLIRKLKGNLVLLDSSTTDLPSETSLAEHLYHGDSALSFIDTILIKRRMGCINCLEQILCNLNTLVISQVLEELKESMRIFNDQQRYIQRKLEEIKILNETS